MAVLTEEAIRNALRQVIDPEIGANIVDLAMVRKIDLQKDTVKVTLVLTAPGCPLAGWIVTNVRHRVGAVEGVSSVEVELLDEPWEPPAAWDWQDWIQRALGQSE